MPAYRAARSAWHIALVLSTGIAAATATAADRAASWVGSWQAAMAAQAPPPGGALKPLQDVTLRERVTLTVGGKAVRIVLSNAYGKSPLRIAAVSVARVTGTNVDAATLTPVLFGGSPGITLPAGAPALSDPVSIDVPNHGDLAVSLYLPDTNMPDTFHRTLPAGDAAGGATGARIPESVMAGPGDLTRMASWSGAAAVPRLFLTRVDVLRPEARGAVVVLGSTRTDGEGRWPDQLAQRLGGRRPVAVLNASMVANPLGHSYPGGGEAALARLDRDVLAAPGVTHLVIADASNDIGQPGGLLPDVPLATLAHLQSAYEQIRLRAQAHGIKVIAATVLPFGGVPFNGFYNADKEAVRQSLNAWLRGAKGYDGVLDFDAWLRDPADPTRFAPGMDVANHFGPSAAGEAKLAERIDLKLFR